MKHSAPHPSGVSSPYFFEAARGRFVLTYCAVCGRLRWPPRTRCSCGGSLEWREASGRGRVASFTVVRRAPSAESKAAAPYIVAFIELDEGVRVFGSLVEAEPAAVRVGMRVRCRFDPTEDPALAIPVFATENA